MAIVEENKHQRRLEELHKGNEATFLNNIIYQLVLSIVQNREKEDYLGLDPDDVELLRFLEFEEFSDIKSSIEEIFWNTKAAFFFHKVTQAEIDRINQFFKEVGIALNIVKTTTE